MSTKFFIAWYDQWENPNEKMRLANEKISKAQILWGVVADWDQWLSVKADPDLNRQFIVQKTEWKKEFPYLPFYEK